MDYLTTEELEGSAMLKGALERWAEVQQQVEEQFGRERLIALEDELSTLSKILPA